LCAYNDADDLRECLPLLDWCDEIVIVISPSEDTTRQVATEYADVVKTVPPAGPGEPFDHFRQVGIDAASSEYIFLTEPDERVPTALGEFISEQLDKNNPPDIIEVASQVFFKDHRLDGGQWWPALSERVIRCDILSFSPKLHNFVNIDTSGNIRRIQAPANSEHAIHHYFADSWLEVIKRELRYAKIEANQQPLTGIRAAFAFPYTLIEWIYLRKNWQAGWRGIIFSVLRAAGRQYSVVLSLWNRLRRSPHGREK
jgi:glycosyltransferase involved in cell wall biosynthesis